MTSVMCGSRMRWAIGRRNGKISSKLMTVAGRPAATRATACVSSCGVAAPGVDASHA